MGLVAVVEDDPRTDEVRGELAGAGGAEQVLDLVRVAILDLGRSKGAEVAKSIGDAAIFCEADVASDGVLQAQLLERAFALTKPGGVIVYSVCSPIPEEGAHQIDKVLAAHPELSIEDARTVLPWLPADAVDARGSVRLLTHRHDADAFFIARLRRR